MANCPICGKYLKNRAGLSGHLQFKHPEGSSPTYKPAKAARSDTSSSPRKQVQALMGKLKALKDLKVNLPESTKGQDQPVQQQPVEWQATTENVNALIQQVMEEKRLEALKEQREQLDEPPKQQPVQQQQQQQVTTVKQFYAQEEQFLAQEKQKKEALEEYYELFDLLKEQMNGTVYHDHEIINKTSGDMCHDLFQYHLYHDWNK